MTLSAGTRLGAYEILGPLGAGGMGVVYRTRDTRLHRDVAIKILPDLFAEDPERVARFQREAQTLAALNHPNIAAIYGLEEAQGSRFLILELVDGETLAWRLSRGPLPLDEALAVARQVVEALEAAHEKGIIHRDLKPANIKITPEGTVKLLDFGLAKVMDAVPDIVHLSQSRTLASDTAAGVLLGTAAYMSPEQARGKAVDRRADIWAFGCLLYEMITGVAAFRGETLTDIIGTIVTTEPDWTALPPETPVGILRLLHRCLVKDPRDRLHDMADARLEIAEAQTAPAVVALPATRAIQRQERAWRTVAAATTVIALAALALAVWVSTRPVSGGAPEMRVEITTPSSSDPLAFALSPDGRQLVFIASGDGPSRLWLRRLEALRAQPLAGTEDATFPFWAPDSRSIGFFSGGKLKRIDLGGGPPQALADAPLGRGGAWSQEGVIVFAPAATGGLARVPATGGEVVPVTRLAPSQTNHRYPRLLPDGQQFLLFAQGAAEQQGIYLGALDGRGLVRLTNSDAAATFLPPDFLLYARQGALVSQRLDLARRELSGDPVRVADAIGLDQALNLSAIAVSAAGPIAYRAGGASRRQLRWVDRTGRELGVVGDPDDSAILNPELSPDGRRVAVYRAVQGNLDVWLLDVSRGVPTRFTFDPSIDSVPIWSPDGRSIVFRSTRTGVSDIYRKPSSGAGSETALLVSSQNKLPSDWSPDARQILFSADEPKTGSDIWVLPLDGDRRPKPFVQTPFSETQAQFSPNGQWVAYQSNESGRFEIYVQRFPEPGAKWQVSTAGGTQPRWRPDGRELFYVSPDRMLMGAPVQEGTQETGAAVPLFRTRLPFTGVTLLKQQYDVAPDGRFLINSLVEDAATLPITLILNWRPPNR